MWLLDLFGQIQAKVANLSEVNETEHFCDILSIAVTTFSGFFTILPKHDYTNIRYYLPSALAYLFKEENWSICTSQVNNTNQLIYKHIYYSNIKINY